MDKLTGNKNALNKKSNVIQEVTGHYLTLPNLNRQVVNEDNNANYCNNTTNTGLTATDEELQALKKKFGDSSDSPPVYAENCMGNYF